MTHPNDFSTVVAPEKGDGQEGSLRKINKILADARSGTAPLGLTAATAANKATFIRGFKAPASIGTPEALAAAGTYVQKVTVFAMRTGRVTNTSSVWVDGIGTNNAQSIELLPGSAANPMGAFVSFEAPPGKVIDLADIYVDAATVTDGVFYLGLV
jgi:hypothetical protein